MGAARPLSRRSPAFERRIPKLCLLLPTTRQLNHRVPYAPAPCWYTVISLMWQVPRSSSLIPCCLLHKWPRNSLWILLLLGESPNRSRGGWTSALVPTPPSGHL